MIILLSPSKTLDFESPLPKLTPTQPRLLEESQTLITTLRKKSVRDIGKLMDISEKLAILNHDRFRTWKTPFTASNARPCFYAFKGDVYEGLEAESFNAKERERAQAHLRILSGLYGLLRPLDLMQPYRLEMGTALATKRGKNLYHFWGDHITDLLNDDLKTQKQKIVINLASEEYFNAINTKKLQGEIITPIFKEAKGNQLKVVSFFAKKARGMMAQYLLKNHITTLTGIQQFSAESCRFSPDLSSGDKLLFIRK